MPEETTTAFCNSCGKELSPNHQGPCPECGNTGKTIETHLKESVSLTGSVSTAVSKEYIEREPTKIIASIVITIVSSLVGFFIGNFYGMIVGLVIGLSSYLLGPKITKVKEKKIERHE